MRQVWLLRGDDVLASVEVADAWADRARSLRGRSDDEGVLLLKGAPVVHSVGVRAALDVAFLRRDLTVVATSRLRPWGIALPRRGAWHVLAAQAGAFERWRLRAGDQIEIREPW